MYYSTTKNWVQKTKKKQKNFAEGLAWPSAKGIFADGLANGPPQRKLKKKNLCLGPGQRARPQMGQGPSNYPCSSPLLLADTSTAPFPQPHEPSLSKPLLPPLLPSLSRCPPLQHQYLNWSSETDRGGREDQGDVLDRGFPPTSPCGFSWGSLG